MQPGGHTKPEPPGPSCPHVLGLPAPPATAARDRRSALTEYLRARAAPPLPWRAHTPPAPAGLLPHAAVVGAANLTPLFIQDRTAYLEASMASLRTRASTLSATVTSLTTQRSGLLTSLHGTQQSVNALISNPSSRTTTAVARALAAVQARTGLTMPT